MGKTWRSTFCVGVTVGVAVGMVASEGWREGDAVAGRGEAVGEGSGTVSSGAAAGEAVSRAGGVPVGPGGVPAAQLDSQKNRIAVRSTC
jgi:hypothetical protein